MIFRCATSCIILLSLYIHSVYIFMKSVFQFMSVLCYSANAELTSTYYQMRLNSTVSAPRSLTSGLFMARDLRWYAKPSPFEGDIAEHIGDRNELWSIELPFRRSSKIKMDSNGSDSQLPLRLIFVGR